MTISGNRSESSPEDEDEVVIPLSAEMAGQLDAWIAALVVPTSRADAALSILRTALSGTKSRRAKRAVSGPPDAPMIRTARNMKAAGEARHSRSRPGAKRSTEPAGTE